MSLFNALKAISIAAVSITLAACANSNIHTKMSNYSGQRVGLISTVGNTAVMSIHSNNPYKALFSDKTTAYQQNFAPLQLNKTITTIAAKQLKQKYPNLIVIPNKTQQTSNAISIFDKRHPAENPNRKFINSIIKKYRLDHLFVITYGSVQNSQMDTQDGNAIRFGIACRKLLGSKYTASYFATWQLLDITAKDYAETSSFWDKGTSIVNADQSVDVLGASKVLGLHPGDEATLCQNLLNKKLSTSEENDFLTWVTDYYTNTAKQHLN